tara:strand:+ start:39 stop:266 length:228 start_codon:yes stop_codon:yes gene_type:complete
LRHKKEKGTGLDKKAELQIKAWSRAVIICIYKKDSLEYKSLEDQASNGAKDCCQTALKENSSMLCLKFLGVNGQV